MGSEGGRTLPCNLSCILAVSFEQSRFSRVDPRMEIYTPQPGCPPPLVAGASCPCGRTHCVGAGPGPSTPGALAFDVRTTGCAI